MFEYLRLRIADNKVADKGGEDGVTESARIYTVLITIGDHYYYYYRSHDMDIVAFRSEVPGRMRHDMAWHADGAGLRRS